MLLFFIIIIIIILFMISTLEFFFKAVIQLSKHHMHIITLSVWLWTHLLLAISSSPCWVLAWAPPLSSSSLEIAVMVSFIFSNRKSNDLGYPLHLYSLGQEERPSEQEWGCL
jgi:hypothetical protein